MKKAACIPKDNPKDSSPTTHTVHVLDRLSGTDCTHIVAQQKEREAPKGKHYHVCVISLERKRLWDNCESEISKDLLKERLTKNGQTLRVSLASILVRPLLPLSVCLSAVCCESQMVRYT